MGVDVAVVQVGHDASTVVVGVITPDEHRRTVTAFLGHSAVLDAYELQRFRLLAKLTASRFVVVETPGCGTRPTRLLPDERCALLQSDLAPLATRMDVAAVTAIGSASHTILGYSLGASLAAAAVPGRRESGTSPCEVVLVEPVGIRRWSAAGLYQAARAEDRLIDPYLAETADTPGAVPPADQVPGSPRPFRRRIDMLATINALRAGRLADDLTAGVTATTTVVVARGTSSHYSDPDSCARIGQRVRDCGGRAIDVAVPGSHGLWHSLPRVEDLALRLSCAMGWK